MTVVAYKLDTLDITRVVAYELVNLISLDLLLTNWLHLISP